MWVGWSSEFVVLRKLIKSLQQRFLTGQSRVECLVAKFLLAGWSFKLRNRILRLFDPPHQMMSSLQLRAEAQLGEFGAAIAEATGLVKSYFPRFFEGMKPVCHYFVSLSSTSCRKVKLCISLNKFQGWKSNYLDTRWSFRVCDLAPKSLVAFEFYMAH